MNITSSEINSVLAIAARLGVDLDGHPIAQLGKSDFWTNLSPKERDRCEDQIVVELDALADALSEARDYVNAAVVHSVISNMRSADETD